MAYHHVENVIFVIPMSIGVIVIWQAVIFISLAVLNTSQCEGPLKRR